ncbi:MAG TPA: hypothetical protein VIA62_11200 [Thermoanaerobaculia bacterium]|jgi:hypothetical protein|nr:hypothetical protein [Thermoanaerobaculia bacterium]
MQYRALPLALSLALAAGPLRSDIVTCPCGKPANTATPIAYRFKNCGRTYTQDKDQLAFCPILGAQKKDLSGNWEDLVSPIQVEEIRVNTEGGAATATVSFPEKGRYRLILSYTPFVYSQSQEIPIEEGEPLESRVVSFPPPEPSSLVVVRVNTRIVDNLPGNLDLTFSNPIPSVDPYEAVTRPHGTFLIQCFTSPVYAFINDLRGCFQGSIALQPNTHIININLEDCKGF